MIRLALLRHGHTSWNREGRIQGRTDMPLEPQAREDLAALTLPEGWETAAVVASPLARAVETAKLVTGRSPREEPALIEMNWGAWEGQRGQDLRADAESGYRDIEHWGWDFTPPGGEPPATLRDRLTPWLAAVTQDTVAICHIGVMRVILAMATGHDFTGTPPVPVKRNRLFVLTLDAGTIRWTGDTPRLRPR
ncbi:MAG: histidine phosphatase family protein [Pseudomonadota bacterium]